MIDLHVKGVYSCFAIYRNSTTPGRPHFKMDKIINILFLIWAVVSVAIIIRGILDYRKDLRKVNANTKEELNEVLKARKGKQK